MIVGRSLARRDSAVPKYGMPARSSVRSVRTSPSPPWSTLWFDAVLQTS
jgi:hypothetical protein